MISILRYSLLVLLTSVTCWAAPYGLDATMEGPVTITSSDAYSLGLEFTISNLDAIEVSEDGHTYDFQYIPGEGTTYEYNKPILPAISRFIVVPPDAGIQLNIDADDPRSVSADNLPMLCMDENMAPERDGEIGQNQGIYPQHIAEMSEPVVMRGVRMVKVTTFPIQYDFDNRRYLIRDHIAADLEFTDEEPVNPAFVPVRKNRSEQFLKTIREIAINGDEVGRDDPDVEPEYIGHYLVVAHENCIDYVGDFIEWRRKSGWKVDIYAVPSNQATNTGTIKREIQERYDAYLDDGIDPFDELLIIGDRAGYSGDAGSPQWQIGAEAGESIWGNPPHADYKYSLLEGGNNDSHPDVGFSRWCAGDANKLALFQGRTLAYEAHPYMEDTDWFTRGAAYSQHWGNTAQSAWHITVHTNVRWAEEVLQAQGFDDVRFHERYEWDQQGQAVGPFVARQLNDGVNLLLGRAENYYWRSNFNGVDNNADVFPIRLVTSGHGEWTTWNMLRGGGASGNNLKGPVASTCGWGGPATVAMSAIWLELVNGVVQRDLTLGWGRTMAVINLERLLSNFNFRGQNVYPQTKTDFDCYGDPGIQPWMGVPQIAEADYPASITPDTRKVDVYVFDPEDETDVPGAQVTLYAPGDIPDYDANGYPNYDDMQMWTTKTDSNGMAYFVFPEGTEFEDGTPLLVTVTGRAILPFFGEADIDVPRMSIELEGYTLTETDGNNDGDINPGEVFELNLTAGNLGNRDEAFDVTATVRSLSPWVSVSEDAISFGDIDHGQSSEGDEVVTLTISPACPDGETRPKTRPVIEISFTNGEDIWQSAIKLNPVAPNFVLERVIGGETVPTDDDEYNLNVDIRNIGGMDAPALNAELVANGIGITPISQFASYPEIDAGRSSRIEGNPFLVAGNRIVVPGSTTELMIVLSNDAGFVDTVFFAMQVGETGRNKPGGPDGYGYICFDDTDSNWDMSPDYDWVEISRDERERDYNGVRCDFEGDSPEDVGEALVVDLGFDTQFYGRIYNQITICTNGYICMGDQGRITNFQNWPMDRAMAGGAGMIAPLWDRLKFDDDSDIYYYYDREDNRFIIEWYKLRHFQGGNSDLTFQVILYDTDIWVTETGDQNILIQYKDVANVGGQNQADWYIPYASVGISSPDGSTGYNYSFDNEYPVTSAPLADRRAILFATSPKYRSGILYGWIHDARTGDPVEDAIIITEHGLAARTDEEGYYRIGNALAEINFDITARKLGYNDSTLTDRMIEEDDSLEVSFDLLHPEFAPTQREFSAMLDPNFETELNFSLENSGNGPMDWTLRKRLPGNADVDPWERRQSFFAGDTVDNTRMKGVVWVNDKFYCTGGGGSSPDDNFVYVLDREGVLIDSFSQFGDSRYGMGDLAYDGGLIWGGEDELIFGFTPEGEVVHTFQGPYNPNQAVAYDSDRQMLWISAKTSRDIAGYDREGRELTNINRFGFTIYGLSYWPDDPDGYPLYVQHNVHVAGIPDRTMIHKINPETEDTLFVAELSHEFSGRPEGSFITNQYDVYSWVYMSVANADDHGDRIDLWQMDARRDWYRVYRAEDEPDQRQEVSEGRIEAGEEQNFTLFLNSYDLPRVAFEGQLLFTHNAAQGADTLYVVLDVIGDIGPSPFNLIYPAQDDVLDANELDETLFEWEESEDPNWGDVVRYSVWLQSEEDSMLVGVADSTSMPVDLLALSNLWPDDPLRSLTWWVVANSDPEQVTSNSRNSFGFVPNAAGNKELNAPVEFGLESVYPSPFNGITTVSFGMDRVERVALRTFDISGREVATLINRTVNAGSHRVTWNASHLPSGVYMLRLESAGRVKMSKVALIK